MEENTNQKSELILTGSAGRDIDSFLKSKDKPIDFGLLLLKNYVRNSRLYYKIMALKLTDEKLAKRLLIKNLKVIHRKWN